MKKIMYCTAQMRKTDKYVNAMHIDFKSYFWYDLDQAPRPHAAQVEKYTVAWEQVVRFGLFNKQLPGPQFSKLSKYVAHVLDRTCATEAEINKCLALAVDCE